MWRPVTWSTSDLQDGLACLGYRDCFKLALARFRGDLYVAIAVHAMSADLDTERHRWTWGESLVPREIDEHGDRWSMNAIVEHSRRRRRRSLIQIALAVNAFMQSLTDSRQSADTSR